MTVITHAPRRSRLAKLIDAAGGVSVGVALTRARANLEALRPRCVEELTARIAELDAIQPPAAGDETAALARIYRAANSVIDAAGPFELRDICAVAAGLCDLIDAATPERRFDWRVLPVCVQSLRLLMTLPADAADGRARVRANFDEMVGRKLSQTG